VQNDAPDKTSSNSLAPLFLDDGLLFREESFGGIAFDRVTSKVHALTHCEVDALRLLDQGVVSSISEFLVVLENGGHSDAEELVSNWLKLGLLALEKPARIYRHERHSMATAGDLLVPESPLFGAVLHQVSHKTQLFLYLKLLGVNVDTHSLYGME